MAVVKHGSLIADIRGKVGDVVYSRGQGGPIARCIGLIDSEDTDARHAMRDNLIAVAQAWSDTLSAAQRSAWSSYAGSHARPNRWGTPTNPGGYLTYMRHNLHAYRATGSLQFPDAPTAAPLHIPVLVILLRTSARVTVAGTLNPDATGTYLLTGIYANWPYWQCTTPSGVRYLWGVTNAWRNTATLGVTVGPYWRNYGLLPSAWYPYGGATGTPAVAWAIGDTLARVTCPPSNYAAPPADLTLHLFAGLEIAAGRNYYSGPWRYARTLDPPIPATAGYAYAVWPYVISAGHAGRAYAVAQDADTVAISTKGYQWPTIEAYAI